MTRTLVSLLVHTVFSTRNRTSLITSKTEPYGTVRQSRNAAAHRFLLTAGSAGRARLSTLIVGFILISVAASASVMVRRRAAGLSFHWPVSFTRILASRTARTLGLPVPVGNQCTSLATGNWNDSTKWTNCGGTFPGAADDVFIEAGHAITLTASQACNDLNLNNTGSQTRLDLGANTLSVNGKLRAYTGAAPGTSGTPTSTAAWIKSTTGKISIVGNARALTSTGEWSAGNAGTASPNGFDLEINLTAGQTVTAATGIKARSWDVVSGTLDTQGVIAVDNGTTGQGDITIGAGGTVISSQSGASGSNPVFERTTTVTSAGTLNVNGLLQLTGTSPVIAMSTINFASTVEYSKAGTQTLALATGSGANPSTYANLKLSGTSAKTLGVNTTVNGTLTMAGTASLALSTFTLTYGASSTLEYAGSVAQTTANTEFPSSGGPNSLTVNNSNGVGLNGAKSINGTLTLTSGALTTGANTLTIGSGASVTRTSGYIIGNEKKTFDANGSFTFDVGTANGYSPVDVNVTSGTGDFTISAAQSAQPTLNSSMSLQRYWTLTATGLAANLVFHYLDPTDIMGNESDYRIIRVAGGAVVSFPNSCPAAPCVDTAANAATINGISSFSDWTVGEPVAPTAANGNVSGQIVDSNGNPVEGAAVRMSGTQNRLTVTNAAGNYHFDDVETNGLYTIVPTRANFSFSPSQRAFSQLGQHTDAAFNATPTGNALNPLDTTEYFVRQQYVDFLGREPDESGFNFWVNNIESCGANAQCREAKRIDTSVAFFLSIEFQQTGYLVYRTYQAAYGDMPNAPVPIRLNEFKPDTQEMGNGVIVLQSGWEQQLENNKQAYAAEFVQRARFVSAYPATMTPAEFVEKLFITAGVTPSDADRTAAISEFGSASTSSDVAARGRALRRVAENSVLAQQEINQAFVLMEYFGYLQRDANTGPDTDFTGYNFWLDKLNTFGGNFQNAEMVKAFLVSGEYRGRFPK